MKRRVVVPAVIGLAIGGAVAAAAVRGRVPRPAPSRAKEPAGPGWATCSAPSASSYEFVWVLLLGGLYRRMAADLAAALADMPEPVVLEIGPGPGELATELARRVPALRLTGLDIDPGMVERATERARRAGLEDRLGFVVGDVAALPFAEGSFDVVTSSFSAHHWPDAVAGFAEIHRVLRPGGRAVVFDLPDAWGRFETHAPPLLPTARAGGLVGATDARFAWPGPIGVVRRLEATRV